MQQEQLKKIAREVADRQIKLRKEIIKTSQIILQELREKINRLQREEQEREGYIAYQQKELEHYKSRVNKTNKQKTWDKHHKREPTTRF